MTTKYKHRYFIFAEMSKLNAANGQAHAWDKHGTGSDTFGAVRLSATGNEPATHTACNTAATDEMQKGITTALSKVPWAGLYLESDDWTWDTALTDMGLQMIAPEDI